MYEYSQIIQRSSNKDKIIGNGIPITDSIFVRVIPYSETKAQFFNSIRNEWLPLYMTLHNLVLADVLKKAYSAEKAAAFAYQGHAASVKDPAEKAAIHQIELDEWNHRKEVLAIMNLYGIPVSKWYEFRFHVIGKIISLSCHVIGWFMPFFFAGKLESGNVCEYFRMMQMFYGLGITDHNEILYEMGIKEKEHEIYFLGKIKNRKLLPFFEKLFSWGAKKSYNDVDLAKKYPVEESRLYCKK